MKPIEQFSKQLQKHLLATYFGLRLGMGFIALAFPLLLCIGGLILTATEIQGSLSAYYHTPMRNVFVGGLFAIGPFLYLYKGFSSKENIALNVAGILAIGVAIFPMAAPAGITIYTNPALHGFCAVVFFACIAYVCIFRSGDTLPLVSNENARQRYRQTYLVIGILMIVLPLTAALLLNIYNNVFGPNTDTVILGIEWGGVWVFSAYWLIKTWELHHSCAEREVFDPLKGKAALLAERNVLMGNA